MKQIQIILKLDGETYTCDVPERPGDSKATILEHYCQIANVIGAYMDMVLKARGFLSTKETEHAKNMEK